MKSLISVIIPAYNHEKYVQETISSILEQTYENIELLIVDDGSKDSTWQKMNELKEACEKRFARVVFVTQENNGICETLNRLIALSQGEYIYIIASDDIAKPQALEKLSDFLSQNPDFSLVVGDNEIIDFESKRVYWDKDRNIKYDPKVAKYKTFVEFLKDGRKDVNFKSKQFGSYASLIEMNYIPNGYLIKKDILTKTVFFTTEAPLEDYYMMLQISKYSKMKYLDEILFSYRWHCGNTVKNANKMNELTKKTKEYEKELIKTAELKNFLPEVQEYIKNGEKTFRLGIPFFFELYKTKTLYFKKIYIKFFGVEINIKTKARV